MKKRLNGRETLLIATMLFGMFFGAGNLIFPVYMGQLAGRNIWKAIAGFIITGVSMPLLGVAAIGVSRSNGLFELSSKVSRPYGYFFTCALYLSIGPFFAIPRCATVPFTVAVSGLLPAEEQGLALAVFSLIFFALVLGFSLNPGKILTYVGKVLTPVFLVFLAILVIMALVNPVVDVAAVEPQGSYISKSFFTGFLEGYNTMDMLASLAFGIVVINVLRSLGVNEPQDIARSTAKAGFFSCLIMAVIYVFVTLMGAQSSGMGVACANGGEVLSVVANHYFGRAGADSGRDGHAGVPQNLGRTGYQLRGNLCSAVPQGPALPRMGGHFQRALLPGGQSGPERDHRLLPAGADAAVSAGHHTGAAGPAGRYLPARPRHLCFRHLLHPRRRAV